jgi:hypothetical protein
VLRAFLTLENMQSFNIFLVIVSRLQQIIPVYQSKSAGQLAVITWILNFAGAAGKTRKKKIEENHNVKIKEMKNERKKSFVDLIFVFLFSSFVYNYGGDP